MGHGYFGQNWRYKKPNEITPSIFLLLCPLFQDKLQGKIAALTEEKTALNLEYERLNKTARRQSVRGDIAYIQREPVREHERYREIYRGR